MIVFTEKDAQMMAHVSDVIGDRMRHEDGYTEQDEATVAKLDQLAKTSTTAVVITGDEQYDADAVALFRDIVKAELRHWVPDASQRLLFRAGRALGIQQPDPSKGAPDCGVMPESHALIHDWVTTLYLLRCSHCFRLFRDGD